MVTLLLARTRLVLLSPMEVILISRREIVRTSFLGVCVEGHLTPLVLYRFEGNELVNRRS